MDILCGRQLDDATMKCVSETIYYNTSSLPDILIPYRVSDDIWHSVWGVIRKPLDSRVIRNVYSPLKNELWAGILNDESS